MTANGELLVSAIMPVKAPAPWLHEAVESVMSQSYATLELVCVLDGFDESAFNYLASQDRVRLIVNQFSRGPSAARRQAVEAATGTIVAPIDADDVWLPHHVGTLVSALTGNPNISLVGTNALCIDEAGNPTSRRVRPGGAKTHSLVVRNQFVNSGSAYWLSRAIACGSYDANVRVVEDYDLWIRLAMTGQASLLDETPTVMYRNVQGGESKRNIDGYSRRAVAQSRKKLARHLGFPEFLANAAQMAWEVHLARRRVERFLFGAFGT